jgi:hypothetical protein
MNYVKGLVDDFLGVIELTVKQDVLALHLTKCVDVLLSQIVSSSFPSLPSEKRIPEEIYLLNSS